MRPLTVSAILATALLGSSAHADGDGLTDVLGPREIAVGEGLRGGATGESAVGLNPSGLPLTHELVFEGGYGYRGADAASLVGVSACDSTNALPGCFFYNYASTNPDSDGMSLHSAAHVGGLAVAYPITPRVFLGTTAKYFHYSTDLMGQSNSSGFTNDVGLTVRMTDIISLGAAGYNILGATSDDFPRAFGTGLVIKPLPVLRLGFDSRWKFDGSGGTRYGGGAEFILASGQMAFPIRAGALRDTALQDTYLSGGLGVATVSFSVDVAARFAVSGPKDTEIIASLRFFGPRMPAPGVN